MSKANGIPNQRQQARLRRCAVNAMAPYGIDTAAYTIAIIPDDNCVTLTIICTHSRTNAAIHLRNVYWSEQGELLQWEFWLD